MKSFFSQLMKLLEFYAKEHNHFCLYEPKMETPNLEMVKDKLTEI